MRNFGLKYLSVTRTTSCFFSCLMEMTDSGKPVVYITRKTVPQAALDLLTEKCIVKRYGFDAVAPRDVLIKEAADADALFCVLTEKVDEDLLQHLPKLKVIATMSVGYEHIDIEACKARKILLGYTPDVLTEATAELAIALLLCTTRRLIEANRQIYGNNWGTWNPFWMCGRGLYESTVGILGLGRIGMSIARKTLAFRPQKVLYHNRKPINAELANSLGVEYVDFDTLLTNSDFLIISCQLNDSTRHIIDAKALQRMKPNAMLVNISRGLVIDQEALYDALKTRQIRAAGLDVCTPEPLPKDHKLLQLDNVVVLPHIGSATIETRTRMAIMTAKNILAGLSGEALLASVY